jgi:signal peptidase I
MNKYQISVLVLLLPMLYLSSIFTDNYKIVFNEQEDKSIPGSVWYVDLNDKDVDINNIVAFKPPVLPTKFEDYSDREIHFLKFVKAKEGDLITIKADKVYVNKTYLTSISRAVVKNLDLTVKDIEYRLNENEYFVFGDHPRSYDSRYFGPVKINLVIGESHEIF